MTEFIPSLCYACERYLSDNRCEAYPAGIPDVILFSGADHRGPLPGDHGKQFLLAEGDTAMEMLEQWVFVFG